MASILLGRHVEGIERSGHEVGIRGGGSMSMKEYDERLLAGWWSAILTRSSGYFGAKTARRRKAMEHLCVFLSPNIY